jgi:hypothetical protein
MASTLACGSSNKRSTSPFDLEGEQRVEKKQRRQLPVTRINEHMPLSLPCVFSNPAKDNTFSSAPKTIALKSQEEINAYLDKQGFEAFQERSLDQHEEYEVEMLQATKLHSYSDTEHELRRKALRKEKISRSTATDWVTWSNEELLEVWNMHLGFPVPRRQNREKLLEATQLLYMRVQLDEAAAAVIAGKASSVGELNYIQLPDSDGPVPGEGLLHGETPKPARGFALQDLQFGQSFVGPSLESFSTHIDVV